jgi:hypothetical protein
MKDVQKSDAAAIGGSPQERIQGYSTEDSDLSICTS